LVNVATRGVIYGTFREILGDEDGKDKIVLHTSLTTAPNGYKYFSIISIKI